MELLLNFNRSAGPNAYILCLRTHSLLPGLVGSVRVLHLSSRESLPLPHIEIQNQTASVARQMVRHSCSPIDGGMVFLAIGIGLRFDGLNAYNGVANQPRMLR